MAKSIKLQGRPPAFDVTGNAQSLSIKWTSWLEEFEAYADSTGLFLSEDSEDGVKQQRRVLLLYTAGRPVRDIFLESCR